MGYTQIITYLLSVCVTSQDKSSEFVCLLSSNTLVNIEEIYGMRCKISAPCKGWISLKAVDIYKIIQKLRVNLSIHDYLNQVSDFFEQQWLKPC